MPIFLDVPREVRDMIYAEALVTDNVLIERHGLFGYPGPADEHLINKPQISLALLQVNKQVNAEATRIFLT